MSLGILVVKVIEILEKYRHLQGGVVQEVHLENQGGSWRSTCCSRTPERTQGTTLDVGLRTPRNARPGAFTSPQFFHRD